MELFENNIMKTVEKISWNEDELFNYVKAGNKDAFEQLYRNHSVGIYCNLRKMTKNDALAKELLQDVFIKVWEKKAVLNPKKPFQFYLFRIAQNSVTDFYRRVRRDNHMIENLRLLTSEITHQPIESVIAGEEEELMLKAMEALPPQRKKIFILCKLEGKSYEEVSGLLGISTSTIGDHIVKGTKYIRKQLIKAGDILLFLGF